MVTTLDAAAGLRRREQQGGSTIKEDLYETGTVPERTAHYDDIPAWMQAKHQNIRTGHHLQSNSLVACFWSLFYPHNELMNVWSHLLPALCCLCSLIAVDYSSVFRSGVDLSAPDTAIIQLYDADTATCQLLSAVYHCTSSHSEYIARHLLKLDYLGITVSICVTNIALNYVGLYNDSIWQPRYTGFSLLYAATVFVVVLDPRSSGPKTAPFRVILFAALMGSGVVGMLHKAITAGRPGLHDDPLAHVGLICLCYLIGAAFYVAQWPECRRSKTFDIWGASHQIFHCWIVLGQFIFFLGLKKAVLIHY